MNTCVICHDNLEYKLVSTSCNHTFHKECILLWCQLKKNCPICRNTLDINHLKEIIDIYYIKINIYLLQLFILIDIYLFNNFSYYISISYKILIMFISLNYMHSKFTKIIRNILHLIVYIIFISNINIIQLIGFIVYGLCNILYLIN